MTGQWDYAMMGLWDYGMMGRYDCLAIAHSTSVAETIVFGRRDMLRGRWATPCG